MLTPPPQPASLAFDELELDLERLELRRAGKAVRADRVAVQLLACLLRNAGRLVSKEQLIAEVWQGRAITDTVISVSMSRLRKTLGRRRDGGEFVANEYGRGYRFVCPVVTQEPRDEPAPGILASTVELPFVGRAHSMARLRQALVEAHAGRGRLCVLMGEAGIGKTRAVEMMERELSAAGSRMAWGLCREVGDTPPLWPWLQLLRELGCADQGELVAALPAELLRLLRPPQFTAVGDGHQDDGGQTPSPRPSRHRTFDAMAQALGTTCRREPLLLVLEDLHRADAASLDFAAYLIDEIARLPLLLVATLRRTHGRATPQQPAALSYLLGHRNCERIALERLSEAEVATYVRAAVGRDDARLSRAVFEKSEGNPFFMVELARQLVESNQPEPSALGVPDAALELLRQRIARLQPACRDLLATASVIGRRFDLALLQATTRRGADELMQRLDAALEAGVIFSEPDAATAFRFSHELLRAIFYEDLPSAEQRARHLRVAGALEQRRKTLDTVPPSDLAYHTYAALPDGEPRRAVQHCREAAMAFAAAHASADVVRYARHALEALELLEHPSLRLRLRLSNLIALYAGALDAAQFREAVEELLRLAREHGDGVMLVRAAVMLSPRPGIEPAPGLRTAASDALRLLPQQETAARAVALATLACAAPHCYDAAQVEELCAEALDLARAAGLRSALHWTLRCALHLQDGASYGAASTPLRDELEQLLRSHPGRMPVLAADLSYFQARAALQRGDVRGHRSALQRSEARCRELGHGELLWHCQRGRAMVDINAGRWSEGLLRLSELHGRAERGLILGSASFCAFDRVVVATEVKALAEIDDALRAAMELDRDHPPGLWAMKVRSLAKAELHDDALAALHSVPASELARLPRDLDYLGTLGQLARAALQLDALEYAEALVPLLAPHQDAFAGHVAFFCEGAVPQLLGMLAEALGQHAEAERYFERGVAMNERAGFAPRAAEAQAQLASCLLATGRPEHRPRALELATRAHASAVRMGMQRLARQAADLR